MTALLSSSVRRQIAGRLSWGVADQAVSSLENFLLGVYVAKSMGATSLGALGLALVAYAIAINASRALSTDPLMVRFSNASKGDWRNAVASSGGVALLAGVASGVVCLALGVILKSYFSEPEAGAAFLALGVVLPGLTLQDSWRYAFFAAGKGSKAFVNDLVWTVLLLATLFVGHAVSLTGVTWAVFAFGGTAALAGVFGMLQAHVVPRCRGATDWLRRHRDLGPRFLVENVVLGAAGKVRSFLIAATVGLAAVGAIRGAEMLIGPVAAILMGVAQVAVPEAARALDRGRRRLVQLCFVLSVGLAAGALAWGLVIVVLFPLGIGDLLLGSVWKGAHVLALGVVVSAIAGCLQIGPSAGLRALGRADRTMRCQIAASIVIVALSSAGALAWGALGAVWGTAVASVVGAGIWWRELMRAQREHATATTEADFLQPVQPDGLDPG